MSEWVVDESCYYTPRQPGLDRVIVRLFLWDEIKRNGVGLGLDKFKYEL